MTEAKKSRQRLYSAHESARAASLNGMPLATAGQRVLGYFVDVFLAVLVWFPAIRASAPRLEKRMKSMRKILSHCYASHNTAHFRLVAEAGERKVSSSIDSPLRIFLSC